MKELVAGLLLGLAVAAASAQGIPLATLKGIVTSEDGAPIENATVRLVSPALQGSRETETSRAGEYLVALLPPGEYRVHFAASGMQESSAALTLPAAATVTRNQVLRTAAVSESVTVSAEAPVERGPEVSFNIPQETLNRLPSGRTVRDAALLAPGVNENGPSSSLGSASQRPAIMISGAASYENLFLVNGAVVNENLRGQPQDLFIEDAIQETTVQTGRVSAEYGRFLGGVVNVVTRSGGNRASGSFRATMSSDQWSANNAYDSARGIDNRAGGVNTTYEGTLGFPVLIDHLWAFGAGRYADIGQTFETRPAPAPGNSDLTPVPYTYGRRERRVEGKLTGAPAPGTSIVGSYIDNRLEETGYAFNRAILSTETVMPRSLPDSLLAVNANSVLSRTLFLEAQYSRRRFEIDQEGPDLTDRIRGTHITDNKGGGRFGAPQFGGQPPNHYDNDSWSLKASYLLSTASLGDHDLRAGYDFFRESTLLENDSSSSGFWISETRSVVRGTDVFPSLSDDGTTQIQWYPVLAAAARTDLLTHSFWVNDRLRLGARWSVNLGLRWDKNHDTNSDGILVSSSASWSPRLGVHFDPRGDGRIVFDGGYGKYVAKLHDNLANAASTAGQVGQFLWTYRGPCLNCDVSKPTGELLTKNDALARLFAWFDSIGGTASIPQGAAYPGFSTRLAPGGLRSPYTREASAGAEAALGSRGSVRVDWLYRDYRDSYNGRIDLTTGRTPPDPYGNVYDIAEIGNSNDVRRRYVAAQIQGQYRIGERLSLTAMYTWSHLTGNYIGETNRTSAYWAVIDEYPEYKQARWNSPYGDITGGGVSPFSPDQRHRARIWVVYQVPVRLANVSVAGLEAFDSGVGYEVAGSIDPRKYVIPNPGYANPLGNVAQGAGLVTYYFTRPGTYRTDNITHTDLALDCGVPVAGGLEVFVHAQVFNLWNEAGVVAVDTTVQTNANDKTLAQFNPFTDEPKQGVNYRLGPNFGKPLSSAGYQPPRSFQLGVGVRF